MGGILRFGIPDFRLDKEILDNVINKIKNLGIEFRTNCELGRNLNLNELSQNFDAVFLGIGANIPWKMGIDGENLQGVYGANKLLEIGNHPNYIGKDIAIIGGGNVAIDVARTIKRLGAKSATIIYRRTEKEMPAEKKEIEEAKKDGVNFLFQTNILKIIGDKKVEKIECIKTKMVKEEGKQRAIPINIEDSNYYVCIDYVVMAIGSMPEKEVVNSLGLILNKYGYINVNDKFETSLKNIYAGGDIVGAKSTVAWAAYTGRRASEAIVEKFKKNN